MSWGGEEERKARPIQTDQHGVLSGAAPNKLVVVDSDAEIIDLIGEGPIEGLVSGTYRFEGKKGYTGFFAGETFTKYTATGTNENDDLVSFYSLGFLRSVYWNDTPVVDQNGYYNFANINVEYTKGLPEGNLASLNPKLPAQESLDLTVERPIGERLYGVSIQGGTVPTSTQDAGDLADDSRIDSVAKTYTILNKECNKIQLRVRVNQLFEQIRSEDAPKDYKKGKKIPPVGYGDIKAREIRYNIYYQPIFDYFSDEINGERPKTNAWTFFKTEIVYGHISQVYIRSTTITPPATYTDQPGFAGWKIKIIRTTPESLTAYLKNTSFIDSIVEIYGTKLRYPYSAMVYSKFDAEFFSKVPHRSYDTKLLKIKVPNNYNPITKTYGRSDAMTKGSDNWYTTTTLIRSGQRIYWQSGAIMKAHTDLTIGTHNLGGWPGTVWVRTGTPYGNHTYPVQNETGATLEGWLGDIDGTTRMGTDPDNFWDGGFKEIVNWPGEEEALPLEGSPTIVKEWTDNPAWCFYDLVTNPRYGLGDYVDNDFVDKWALYEIAQYCDVLVPDGTGGLEPRFTMNHIIVSREEAYKVLNDLSSIFRGLVYYANGLVYAVQDSFKKPLYQFNNTNVVEGSFTYASSAKKARHSVAVVRYINKTNLYLPSVEYVENEEAIKRYGIRQIETTALGCTSRGQARRFGEWLLASEAQETESVSFSVGQDGTYLKPGDVLQIYDQYRTPLKFGGRTNAVEGVNVAPSDITYTSSHGGANAPVTGNSIIIDNAVAFDRETIYKFSLLTPTYNYESTGISDLNSDDEIRRTSIQDLYFLGDHTLTLTGFYSSDYQREGSGIATQIYFHTGLELDTDGDGIGDTPVGTSNQLDFANYVITGYTNDYVNGSLSESYSGGCFSGENLVWSAEINNPTDEAYISGHFSNYRVINVAENDDQTTYSISALAYSTGKYDEVENRLDFGNITIDDPPLWPHQLYAPIAPSTVYTSGTQDNAKITLGNPNQYKWPTSNETKYEGYATFEIRIPQASTKLKAVGEQGENVTQYAIDIEPKYALPDRMTYSVCVFPQETLGNGFDDPSLTMSASLFKAGNPLKSVGTIFHEVSEANYTANYLKYSLYTIDGNPEKSATTDGFAVPSLKDGEEFIDPNKPVQFFLEKLITTDTNYWFAVFAHNNFTRSSHAIVGLIPSSTQATTYFSSNPSLSNNQIPESEDFNIVQGIDISALTSSNLALVGEDEIPTVSYTSLNQLNSTQPSFVWSATNELLFKDDYGKDLEMITAQTYRITIRKYDGRFEQQDEYNADLPSSDIYVELYNVKLPDENAVFDFIHDYNNPHIVKSLSDNPDAISYDVNGNVTASEAATKWFKVEDSGIVYKNSPNNFPLRQFDIVIEAHDDLGKTSAKNQLFNGTLNQIPNNYHLDGDGKDGYDFVPCSLSIPSGIVFAQYDKGWIKGKDTTADGVDDYSFLSQGQAHLRKYPYLATAEIYNNGFLDITMQPSKDAAGNTMLSSSEMLNSFPDVRGLVYYYSTGDNSIIDTSTANGEIIFGPNNKAPDFSMEPANIPGSKDFGAQGNVKFVQSNGTVVSYADAPTPITTAAADPQNVTVYRWYHLFDSSTNPANIRIHFPKIASPNVENIFLTIGLFDTLSYLQHFNADNSAKTQPVVSQSSAATTRTSVPGVVIDVNGAPHVITTQITPTILLEENIKFSTIPYAVYDGKGKALYWSEEVYNKNTKEGLKLQEGTPCFLKESSLQTKGQSALAYRAWWDVTLDPGEQDLVMDFNYADAQYIGPHKLEAPYTQKPCTVTKFENKNKFKGIARISFESFDPRVIPSPGSIAGKKFVRRGYLSMFFETEQDPEKYTVDVEFKGSNIANSSGRTLAITKDGEFDSNPNHRDYITNDYPLPNCKLVEKSRDYVKFYLEPFSIHGAGKNESAGYVGSITSSQINNEFTPGKGTELRWVVVIRTVDKSGARWQNNWNHGEDWTDRVFTLHGPPDSDVFAENGLTDGFTFQIIDLPENGKLHELPSASGRKAYVYIEKSFLQKHQGNGGGWKRYRPAGTESSDNIWPNFGYLDGEIGGEGRDGNAKYFRFDKVPIPTIEHGKSKAVKEHLGEEQTTESVSSQVDTWLANKGAAGQSFVGNIIKIKGGILETDTFDNVPQ